MKKRMVLKRLFVLLASCAAGIIPTECETRIRDSFVDAARITVTNLLNPENFGIGIQP